MEKNETVAILVADLGYGDSGKGGTIDALAAKYQAHTVVRYNGGVQAGHTVVTPEGDSHTFAQFGSGTFIPGVVTYLSKHFYFDPLALLNEEEHLRAVGVHDAYERLFVDKRALLLTPFARAANRLRELLRGEERHGSCGMGIGETMSYAALHREDALRVGDTADPPELLRKLKLQQEILRSEFVTHRAFFDEQGGTAKEEWNLLCDDGAPLYVYSHFIAICEKFRSVDEVSIAKLFQKQGVVLFEGAQGVLLDQDFGFHPYTTWSDTTFAQAEQILDEFNFMGKRIRLGVLRAYATRHGKGPFVTESDELTLELPDTKNITNAWQQAFRVGWFDAVALRYALAVVGKVDALVITNIDRLLSVKEWRIAHEYKTKEQPLHEIEFFILSAGDKGGLVISDIKYNKLGGLSHQEKLTRKLFSLSPHYKAIVIDPLDAALKNGTHQIFKKIESELHVPIALTSYGSTRKDKFWKLELF